MLMTKSAHLKSQVPQRLSSCLFSTICIIYTSHHSSPPNTNLSINMSVKSIVEKSIESDFIVVFSKSYCPYCKKGESVFLLSCPSPVCDGG